TRCYRDWSSDVCSSDLYRDRCAICRLRELRLLDAAHIAGDATIMGVAAVSNGLSLCTIHHRAFDQDLVGVTPDYTVRVAARLLRSEERRVGEGGGACSA